MQKSNDSHDWANLYDIFESKSRDTYKSQALSQNLSHYLMLEKKL